MMKPKIQIDFDLTAIISDGDEDEFYIKPKGLSPNHEINGISLDRTYKIIKRKLLSGIKTSVPDDYIRNYEINEDENLVPRVYYVCSKCNTVLGKCCALINEKQDIVWWCDCCEKVRGITAENEKHKC